MTPSCRPWPQILLGLALLLVGCRHRIETAYDHTASFTKYHSYALDVAPIQLGPWGKRALEETLRTKLKVRGFHEVPASIADLYVVPALATEEKEIVSPLGGRVYFPSNFGRYTGWGDIAQAPNVTQYIQGKLVIDFIDSETRQIVFRGVGEGKVRREEENAANIEAVVTKIVAAFPK